MASYSRRGTAWLVRWRDILHLQQPDGSITKRTVFRGHSVSSEAEAKQLVAEVERLTEKGEIWIPPRNRPVATLRGLALAYLQAGEEAQLPESTLRSRQGLIRSFLAFLDTLESKGRKGSIPVSVLSLPFLEDYARTLPSDGRTAGTRFKKIFAVERMWRWAADRPERFPGVPSPKRLTGSREEADKLRRPPPVSAWAAPTWDEVDAMMSLLFEPWHWRAALILRYTGLRASQVCRMMWVDVDLKRQILRIRPYTMGAKKSKGRVIPLHPALVQEMAKWEPQVGYLFNREETEKPSPHRGDVLVRPFRRAWTQAGIAPEKWDQTEEMERGHGTPTHAFRRCVRNELIRLGVEEALVLYFIGHQQGLTAAAYVPEHSPEQSPYWPRLLEAVQKIPAHLPFCPNYDWSEHEAQSERLLAQGEDEAEW